MKRTFHQPGHCASTLTSFCARDRARRAARQEARDGTGVHGDGDRPMLLDRLEEQAPDSLIALIALAEADPRPDKIDVGVGVYRDAAGNTPILRSVKAAERDPGRDAGDQGLYRLAGRRPLHRADQADRVRRRRGRRRAHRRPADAGRLRRAPARRRADRPGQSRCARIYAGEPTWPNHAPLIASAGRRDGRLSLLRQGQPRRSASIG